jgi:hypothetical protein
LRRQAAAEARPELAAEFAFEWRMEISGKEGEKSGTQPREQGKIEAPNFLEE